MLFMVTRTSGHSNYSPCDEAFEKDGRWWIDVGMLDQLIDFFTKYEQIVIHRQTLHPEKALVIEIYDDYME